MTRSSNLLEETRVLIVEDDFNNRLVAVKLLQVAGIKPENIVELVEDPLLFLDPESDSFDLILLDLQLPGKDGYTILQEFRKLPLTREATIIALTANVMQADVERARKAGFDGFIGKPINGRQFPNWIRRICAGESVWVAV